MMDTSTDAAVDDGGGDKNDHPKVDDDDDVLDDEIKNKSSNKCRFHSTMMMMTTTTTNITPGQQQEQQLPLSIENPNHHPKDQRNRIQLLSSSVIEQIAAGEIVQRTYIAVKELLENSIDAHATQIRITIRYTSTTTSSSNNSGGGCFSLTVYDNGNGISCIDLPLAVLKYGMCGF